MGGLGMEKEGQREKHSTSEAPKAPNVRVRNKLCGNKQKLICDNFSSTKWAEPELPWEVKKNHLYPLLIHPAWPGPRWDIRASGQKLIGCADFDWRADKGIWYVRACQKNTRRNSHRGISFAIICRFGFLSVSQHKTCPLLSSRGFDRGFSCKVCSAENIN